MQAFDAKNGNHTLGVEALHAIDAAAPSASESESAAAAAGASSEAKFEADYYR